MRAAEVVEGGRLRPFLPPVLSRRDRDPRDITYTRTAFLADAAARSGRCKRTIQRWVSRVEAGTELDLYAADILAAVAGVPFAFVYPDAE